MSETIIALDEQIQKLLRHRSTGHPPVRCPERLEVKTSGRDRSSASDPCPAHASIDLRTHEPGLSEVGVLTGSGIHPSNG
jgi:hypothetical protein